LRGNSFEEDPVSGEMVAGREIGVRADQTLTQECHRHPGCVRNQTGYRVLLLA
jgi:hypothetical protein